MAEVGKGVTLTRGKLEPGLGWILQLGSKLFDAYFVIQVQIAAMAWGVNLLSAAINTFGSRGIGAFYVFSLGGLCLTRVYHPGTVAQINGRYLCLTPHHFDLYIILSVVDASWNDHPGRHFAR